MENKTINENTDLNEKKPVTPKKKRKWPWIVLVLLLLICAGGYYAYTNDYLDSYIDSYGLSIPKHHQEEEVIEEKNDPDEKQETAVPISSVPVVSESDPAKMNGTWISDEINNGTFELKIEAPDVYNTNGVKGKIEAAEDPEHDYQIIFGEDSNSQGEIVKLYVDSLEEGSAVVWLPNDDGTYTTSVAMHRSEETALIDNGSDTEDGNSHNSQSSHSGQNSNSGQSANGGQSGKKGHWETRTETIPAWDEQVLVTAGYYEQVLVSEAWDEEETYCTALGYDQIEVEVCNTCGAQFQGGINQHLSETGHSGWHNDYVNVGEYHCLSYGTDYIHHDAVYEQVWHDPVYKTVHHPEETKTYQVWVED